MKNFLNVDNIEEIKHDYYNNENSFLREKYNCCDETLRKFLRYNNVEIKKKPQYTKNDLFFQNIDSEEKAYFLGFICADGSININRNKLSFTLNTKDIEILIKLKNLLKTTAPIASRAYIDKRNGANIESVSLQIYSKKIIEDLYSLNICENKSNVLRLPNIDDNLKIHFIRGLFDGDGYIGTQCTLISTAECLNDIIEYLKKYDVSVSNSIHTVHQEKNIYRISINSGNGNCVKFLNLLYKHSEIHLKRKYLAYLKFLNVYENQIINYKKSYKILIIKENLIIDSIKDCAKYLNKSYCKFITDLNNGCYDGIYIKYEKVITQTKRNGEKIIKSELLL